MDEMGSKMKICPIGALWSDTCAEGRSNQQKIAWAGRCVGHMCAWFDVDKSRCAVRSIARNK